MSIVKFVDGERPELFLIRSTDWLKRPSDLLFYYKTPRYDEFHLRMHERNRRLLDRYAFGAVARRLSK